MNYGIKTATVHFDKDGNITKIKTRASMFGNSSDVRNIEARGSNSFWQSSFKKWKDVLQDIFQKTTAHGSEV